MLIRIFVIVIKCDDFKALQRHFNPSEMPFLYPSVLTREMPDQVGHDGGDGRA